ncbi:type IV secretion protein VblB7 [Bartonella krasnovii]|uniref:Type IV secretion protein VblB7 n=1 Tax=Bartonella krasnovii TaxID=2267275 RepID=A0A5B9D2U2_9HYPH|nr:type IV secretion protein VblB7 [Bartonella krasnovii]QEE12782.1 type IV secretion protein VblB7 [Bartonella krasnovii]UNF35265.1 type IV secretion protein VblB7 [Bartonella krasnovii]UNF38579.1 type IV secretion protein VblB7 [Bartonella krasnovii]UNF40311.1 type IV secretion protein VblB7 [Bartonella krasnovii]UNF45234.1 type IV secretion protein VblB7 [Bartonella krasnovii]
MRELKKIGVILSLILLNGCMSSSHTLKSLPKCDGYSKRPLNRSMWNWEGKKPTPTPIIISNNTTPSPLKEGKLEMLLAQKLTDEEMKSYKNCGQKA